jgi:bacterioferritin-associated ferredoxin
VQVSHYGFVLSRRPLAVDGLSYWSRARMPAGIRTYIALDAPSAGWSDWGRRLLPAGERFTYEDERSRQYRTAVLRDGRLEAVLYVAASPILPSLEWLKTCFDLPAGGSVDRRSLLAGRPLGVADQGPVVCACFQVGRKRIEGAVADGASSVAEIGVATRAGTNCGSCVPELKRLVGALAASLRGGGVGRCGRYRPARPALPACVRWPFCRSSSIWPAGASSWLAAGDAAAWKAELAARGRCVRRGVCAPTLAPISMRCRKRRRPAALPSSAGDGAQTSWRARRWPSARWPARMRRVCRGRSRAWRPRQQSSTRPRSPLSASAASSIRSPVVIGSHRWRRAGPGQAIRAKVEALLHPALGAWAAAAQRLRANVKARLPMGPSRAIYGVRFADRALAARGAPSEQTCANLGLFQLSQVRDRCPGSAPDRAIRSC